MNILKKSMYVGIGIEIIGVLFAVICVYTQTVIPSIVTVLLYLGLTITMGSSLLFRRGLKKSNDELNVLDKKLLFSFVLLIILSCLVTFFCNM